MMLRSEVTCTYLCLLLTPYNRCWVNQLYFAVRYRANPTMYCQDCPLSASPKQLDCMLQKLLMTNVRRLAEHKMIQVDDDGFCLRKTLIGEIASSHYVRVKTMQHFSCMLEPTSTEGDLITALSHAAEFDEYAVRREEKKALRLLNDKVLCVFRLRPCAYCY